MKKFTLLFCTLLTSFVVYSQQILVNKEWSTNRGTQNLFIKTITKTDAARNVYTCGATINSFGNYDWLISKTNKNGVLIWTAQFDGSGHKDDVPADMILSGSALYVVGGAWQNPTDSLDACIIKYSAINGSQQWVRYHGSATIHNDFATCVMVYAGHIYVGGTKYSNLTKQDYVLLKYSSSGTLMFSPTYNHNGNDDLATKIKVKNNVVYLAGGSEVSPTTWDFATVRYSTLTGAQIGPARRITGGSGVLHELRDLYIDNANYVYLTGSYTNGMSGIDIKTVKMDDTLFVIWTATYTGSGNNEDKGNAVTVDAMSNVYVTGYTTVSGEGKNAFMIKYNSSGVEQYKQFYNGIASGDDSGEDIEILNNKVFVGGYLTSVTTGKDYNLLCYIDSGTLVAQKSVDLYGYDDIGTDLAIDGDGSILLAGQSNNTPTTKRYITNKFTILEVSNAIIADTSGAPICKKNEMIIKFNPSVIKTGYPGNYIDDRDKIFGRLSDFIQDSTIVKMSTLLGVDLTGRHVNIKVIKIFKRFTTADSLSITRLGETIKIEEVWSTMLITVPDDANVFAWVDSLNTDTSDIYYAEPDMLMRLNDVPNDGLYGEQWNLFNPDNPNADINIQPAWDYATGTSNVKVGVYDTGIDWEHEDFSRDGFGGFNESVAHNGYDYYNSTNITSSSFNSDYNNHGTRVAGVIGARRDNILGVAGIAGGDGSTTSGVELYNMKLNLYTTEISASVISGAVLDGGAYIISGSETLGLALNVTNHSYGSPTVSELQVQTLKTAFYYAWRNGVTTCVSRGNAYNTSEINVPSYPGCINDLWMITVGAAGNDGEVVNGFSNDPGGTTEFWSMTGSTEIDCIAPGVISVVKKTCSSSGTSDYATFSGTSAASPQVAGVAALISGHYNDPFNAYNFQNMGQDDIEHLVQTYASDRDAPNYDLNTGYGMLDAEAIFQNIHRPMFEIIHNDGLSPDATSSIIEFPNETITIPTNIAGLIPGTYLVDKYVVTHTFNYTLPAGYTFKDSWILKSHTIGFPSVPNNGTVDGNYWGESEIVSSNATQTVVRTRCYSIVKRLTPSLVYYANTWLANTAPVSVKIPFALHIENPTIGIAEVDAIKITAYPNPTSSTFTISGSGIEGLNYRLINILGSVVKSGIINSSENFIIDLSGFQNATYILHLDNGLNYNKSFKIIKL